MKAFAPFVVAACLLTGAAMAEPPPASPPAPPPVKTVEGVTVVAPQVPTKECSPRDKQCILLVVAELKRLYPEQLKRFCFQREMRDMRSNLLSDTDPGKTAFTSTFSGPAALKLACTRDKK